MSLWTINDVVDSAARKFKDRTALIDGQRKVTFFELKAEVDRIAGWLQAQGISKGDKVAIQGRNSLAWVTAFYATLRVGGIAVPLNHKLAPAETAYILDHSESRLWLVDNDLYNAAAGEGFQAPPAFSLGENVEKTGLASLAPQNENHTYTRVEVESADLAELLYTSGTTGRPKGCMHSHASVLLAGMGSSMVYGLSPQDRVLIAMPVWHSFPLNNLLVSSLYFGASVVLVSEYHPQTFLQTVQDKRCTLFFGAPIAYLMPLKMVSDFDEYDLTSMRAWLYGGGPIDADSASMLMERYRSSRFYQVFGMTESGPTGTALLPEEQVSKAGSIGRYAVSGCELKVMLNDETEAERGETGEIWMRCQSMMLGYYRNPEASAAVFHEDWYRTGDLARLDEDGYLFIVDRLKDMIVTGGENVYSKEVEDVLANHPDINEVAVIGTPHAEWGESVTAVIVPREGQEIQLDEVKAYCAKYLAKYKIPRLIEIVDAMPRTPTGKVMKFQLRAAMSVKQP
jgi:feruloyl-CoA synthase